MSRQEDSSKLDLNEDLEIQDIEGEEDRLNSDIETIIQIIAQEKFTPDLILYQQQIVDDLFELLQNQEMSVKEKEKIISEEKKMQIPKNKFLVDLLKEECERVKYLIKLYTRTRIYKLQKFHLHFLRNNKLEYFNVQEKEFLKGYSQLRQQMFTSHLLNKLPQNFKHTGLESDEKKDNQSQNDLENIEKIEIESPNLEKSVFVKYKKSGNYDINGKQELIEEGDIYLLPYKYIKTLHENLQVELV